jgi:tetratricopeptide (TPR) repeat protein
MDPRPAVHRTILVVDVEGFGDRRRTNPHQIAVRDGVYRALRQAFAKASIAWAACDREDRGDGVFILAHADVPKALFVEALPHALAQALHEHNKTHRMEERIRLRMALHAGEINYDDHGMTAAAINLAFRLLEAHPLKTALAESPGVLALIASAWFYDEVIRHSTAASPVTYRPVRISVKETSTVGWIALPDHPYPPKAAMASPSRLDLPVPRQLPLHTPHFVGRADELHQLTTLLDTATEGRPVVISAINGTAGIGKTTLAVHWAHQVADYFPDGQLYVNLRGFDSTGTPMKPPEAIRGFLDALEIPPERIPIDLEDQAALYRRVLVDRKVLVVLDNARDTDQVRPLLPGNTGCRVVITSRNQLASLISHEGAHPVNLDLLSTEEATALLTRHLGHDRITAEPDVLTDLIEHCARLPLALSIVAARAALNPRWPLRMLADELQDEQIRLDALDAGDPTACVRTVFSWSYQQLNEPAARMFRLLGVHPGPDISLPAAASLAGIPLRSARTALSELTHAHLIAQDTTARYTFHDLLRAYATELAETRDPDTDRSAATRRVLDHYLHTAHNAALRIYPRRDPIYLTCPQHGTKPEKFPDCRAALSWFDADHPVLLAVIKSAAADVRGWRLACTLSEFFERRARWRDWEAVMQVALESATRRVDKLGQAHTQQALGSACRWLGRYDEALAYHHQALALFEELGDQTGQAHAHIDIAVVLDQQDLLDEGLSHARKAVDLSSIAGNQLVHGRALNNLGWYYALLERPEETINYCQQAFILRRKIGDRRGEATVLHSLGYAHHQLGHYHKATLYYHRSLALRQELGLRYGEALVLAYLGHTQHVTGAYSLARTTWRHAASILDDLQDPEASRVRARLQQLDTDDHHHGGGYTETLDLPRKR